MDADVLVVGSGGVGLLSAILHAQNGLSVRIIEARDAPEAFQSRALAVFSRSFEQIELACGEEVPLDMYRSSVHLESFELGDNTISVPIAEALRGSTRYNHVCLLQQPDTERFLSEFLAEAYGVEVEYGTSFVRFEEDKYSVKVEVSRAGERHHGEDLETLRVHMLAGCDGGHSLIRKQMGAEFIGEVLPSIALMADVEMPQLVEAHGTHSAYNRSSENGVAIILPFRPAFEDGATHRFRVIVFDNAMQEGLRRMIDADTLKITLSMVQNALKNVSPDSLKHLVAMENPRWLTHFKSNERQTSLYSRRRIYIAGDAAHVHSPAGGQGLNTGIVDAGSAAWRVALLIKGCGSTMLMKDYHEERTLIGRQLLALSGNGQRFVTSRFAGLGAIFVRSAAKLPPVSSLIAHRITQLSLNYRSTVVNAMATESPLSCKGGLRAGDRIRSTALAHFGMFGVASDYKDLYGLIRDVKPKLLLLGFGTTSADMSGLMYQLALCFYNFEEAVAPLVVSSSETLFGSSEFVAVDHNDELQIQLFGKKTIAEPDLRGRNDKRIALVRPDGVLALSAHYPSNDDDVHALKEFLGLLSVFSTPGPTFFAQIPLVGPKGC